MLKIPRGSTRQKELGYRLCSKGMTCRLNKIARSSGSTNCNSLRQQRSLLKDALGFYLYNSSLYLYSSLKITKHFKHIINHHLTSILQNPIAEKPRRRVERKHNCGYICPVSGMAFCNFCQSCFVAKGWGEFLEMSWVLGYGYLVFLINYICKHLIQGFFILSLLTFGLR